MGAVHDYFSGMLSIRNGGASIPEIVGKYLGPGFQNFLRIFSLLLLIFVGVAFVSGPAGLLATLTGGGLKIWLYAIFAYYLIATLLPINKIIGKIYPLFGIALLIMAIGVGTAILVNGFTGHIHIPEITSDSFRDMHTNPAENLVYPMLFIVISCGALSGFHSTQSPMMARTIKKESYGRYVFYGAMIIEGVIALIWATLASSFYHSPAELNQVLSQGGPALVVNQISNTLMGHFGGILAIVGVVILPISSGDTAFRSARLIIADFMNFSQKDFGRRLAVAVPLFIIGFIVSKTDFSILWRYFGWANQTLATIVLWTAAAFLKRQGGWKHWIATLPALFMTVVVTAFLGYAKIGFKLPLPTATIIGLVAAAVCLVLFFLKIKTDSKTG